MLSIKPPLMLPALEMPATIWHELPRRIGTSTILAPALVVYALFLLASWIWGDYGYLHQQALSNDDLDSIMLSRLFPAALLWAVLLPIAVERRTPWCLSAVCMLAALCLPSEVVPHAAFWWIAAVLLLSWAIITSVPSAKRLTRLAMLSRRERSKIPVKLVPVRRAETRRRMSDGLLRSLKPIWMLLLLVFVMAISAAEYFSIKGSAELHEMTEEQWVATAWPASGLIFMVGFTLWSLVGLCRMVMERLIGNVVWILPEATAGPLHFSAHATHNIERCTPNDEVLTPDEVECPRLSPEKMWLGYSGSDTEGHLLHWDTPHWSDQQELVRHRCRESAPTENFVHLRRLERGSAKRPMSPEELLNP